jgi:hypothetical protein
MYIYHATDSSGATATFQTLEQYLDWVALRFAAIEPAPRFAFCYHTQTGHTYECSPLPGGSIAVYMGSGKSTKVRVFTGVSKVATELLEKANGLLAAILPVYRATLARDVTPARVYRYRLGEPAI